MGVAARPGPLQLRPGGHQAGRRRGDQGDLAPQQYPGPAVHDRDRRSADLAAVYYLGKLLKLLMVGRARDILTKAVGRNAYLAMASGMGVTVLTQSSTITNSVLVPFAGAGVLTPAQVYPVTVGANLGTTFTTVFAAFAVVGQDAKIGLQAAFVHLLYNVFAIIVIYVIPVPRPVPCSAPRPSPASLPSASGSSPSTSSPSSSCCPPWSSSW